MEEVPFIPGRAYRAVTPTAQPATASGFAIFTGCKRT
jgi:hypothetical protein